MIPAGRSVRLLAVRVHRWAGLAIALFIGVAALTGSLIAFYNELEAMLIPELVLAPPPAPNAAMLSALRLRESTERAFPDARIDWADLVSPPGRARVFFLTPRDAGAALRQDEVFVDPYTARILGTRRHGDLREGRRNLMPFVYEVHESLALGETGRVVLGVAALVWTLDCFLGLYLTWPVARSAHRASPRQWLSRWSPAWRLRWRAGPSKLTFDLHRASGLWIWLALLVFAWSAVGFNLPPVHQAVMRVFGYVESPELASDARVQRAAMTLDWNDALDQARRLMNAEAQAGRFAILRERSLSHDADTHSWQYRTVSTLDVSSKLGNTTVFFDDANGRLLRTSLPTGSTSANTVDTWLSELHTAGFGGWPLQAAVSATGVLILVLTVSGVEIWRRRRGARRRSR